MRVLPLLLVLTACSRVQSTPEEAPPTPSDRSDGSLPTLRVVHVPNGAIRIDGKLDEPAWRQARSTGGLVSPGDGSPNPASNVQAQVWVLWDDANLYVATRVHDAHPVTPFAPTDVDPHLWERSSAVEIMLQPGDPNDNRNYFELQVDPAGALWATRFDDYNNPVTMNPMTGQREFGHQDWSPGVRSASTRTARAYVIELSLPWRDVATARTPVPPAAGSVWRANFYSFRDGQQDSLAWSPLRGTGNFHRASRFGRLEFAGP